MKIALFLKPFRCLFSIGSFTYVNKAWKKHSLGEAGEILLFDLTNEELWIKTPLGSYLCNFQDVLYGKVECEDILDPEETRVTYQITDSEKNVWTVCSGTCVWRRKRKGVVNRYSVWFYKQEKEKGIEFSAKLSAQPLDVINNILALQRFS